MNFPEILKNKRIERGLKQYELAKLLTTSKQCISAWETGERYPSYILRISLADVFECSLDELVGRCPK